MLLSNEEAIKAQVLYWLREQYRKAGLHGVYLNVTDLAMEKPLSEIATALEGIIATAQTALHTIDEMREPPMDLAECAGVEPKDEPL